MADGDVFAAERAESRRQLGASTALRRLAVEFAREAGALKYTYNFDWLGRPVIQLPQDMLAVQEIIWAVRPELVIETGIARGGSLILSASILELIGGTGRVLGIDIDIRPHNRAEIEKHPLAHRIDMIEGSSIDETVAAEVRRRAEGRAPVMVFLDSNHTHDHVLRELELYAPLVTKESYLVVFDTLIDDMPEDFFPDRPWGKGNNPKTAVRAFLETTDRFAVDRGIEDKLLLTVAPGGWLKCTAE